MSTFWNAWICIQVIVFLGIISWVLYSNFVASHDGSDKHREGETFDGVEEGYAPIPMWWAMAMLFTILFSIGYLAFYPGMGSYKGFLNWTSEEELAQDRAFHAKKTQSILATYQQVAIEDLAQDAEAMKLGRRIYQNNCMACHGRNAKGSLFFPDLSDDDWLYGGTPEAIKTSITEGRRGVMPPWKGVLQAEQVESLAAFLSKEKSREESEVGLASYNTFCIACHGVNMEGNPLLGAPDLSDDIWLYGGDKSQIIESIVKGRAGHMPAQKNLLSENKIHLLTAYVYSLNLEDCWPESPSELEKNDDLSGELTENNENTHSKELNAEPAEPPEVEQDSQKGDDDNE